MTHAAYSLKQVVETLGLSRGVIAGLIDAGYVKPSRGARNRLQFTFRDVVLLRTAYQLRQKKVTPRKLLRAIRELRAQLPEDEPMTALRITSVGGEVAVREAEDQWEATTGQLLFDFSVQTTPGEVRFIERAPTVVEPDAATWLSRAAGFEGADSDAAEHAYREAIRLAPDDADAYLNLGAMLCELEENDRALQVFEAGLQHRPDVALLHFNRAVALEDLGRVREALTAYDAALTHDPAMADAHFNAGRLHEVLGETKQAVRHYNAYRRLHR